MYFIHGKLTAKAGRRDELADLLINSTKQGRLKGCRLYVIAKDENEPNTVYVTEIWDSREDHDNSLKLESVREVIVKAMPIIDGQPQKGQELEILGGLGI
jgi:quinol monooxygenase YgiN